MNKIKDEQEIIFSNYALTTATLKILFVIVKNKNQPAV